MPTIQLKDYHFVFLRTLVDSFLELEGDQMSPELETVANEVKVLLDYTKIFKLFTVNIEESVVSVEGEVENANDERPGGKNKP
jgi:hypothetical protein